jgi:glycosyltransferase involved in cell wall biosynthesis
LKSRLARLVGADRPKIIVVLGATRVEVDCAVRHARAGANLPIRAYCAESAAAVDGCERFVSGPGGLGRFRRELRNVWVALSIVAWTGSRGIILKLFPFTLPPFRILVLNEAGDFFKARPGAIAGHLRRRVRDRCIAWSRRVAEVAESLIYRGGEKVADGVRYIYSLAYRGEERLADGFRLAYSLLYRGTERLADGFGLAWSLLYRAGERALDALRWIYSIACRGLGRAGESLLFVLAILARCVPPLSRYAVARLKERQPLKGLEKSGIEAIEIAIPGRAWPRETVIRVLTESSAEYVVFRRGCETGSAGPLIRMARRTNAFAVAKQVAHSAWRKRVVAKHPFRRLQDSEVSEVFAPFSSLIVIRRDKFLRLGCPRAFTYGSALMLLFWKASAAGLRSLVMGFDGPVTDEPAMDLEDAELALRVTISSALRKLGPQNPVRLRGNVAWSPAYAREFRGKPRVLVVSPYLPFPLSHGGAVRIFNLCREMSGDVDFVLACFRESGETVHYAELHEVFREVYIVDADEKHIDSVAPKQVAEYRNVAMSDLIRRFCLPRLVDLVQLEYTQLGEYRDDTGAVPVLLVEHDITFTLHRQISELTGEIAARREFQRWLEFEREALQCTSAVWTMSEHDKAIAVKYGASRGRTNVIPNGVDLRRFQPEPREAGPPGVLFVGSFRHLPNLLAFEELRESIMPEVWRMFPEVVLHVIAGPGHERAIEIAGKGSLLAPDPRIHVQGFVEDVRPAYRKADVVAIPLPVSAGTNIKLMEAMACGRAIVSTPAGCAGLNLVHGRELIVAEPGPAFARAIAALLADEEERTHMAAVARRTAEIRFGWDSIAREALKAYASITAEPLPVSAKSAKV